jgi:gas vesicle protein
MSDDNRNSFLWFLAGLGVGALTVALYAPQSGVETRRALRSKAQQSRDRLRHHSNRVREQASHWADRSRDFLYRWKNQPEQDELARKAVDSVKDLGARAAKLTAEAQSDPVDAAKKAV